MAAKVRIGAWTNTCTRSTCARGTSHESAGVAPMEQPFERTRTERLTLPRTHEQRAALHNEVHARPPEPLNAPVAITHLVMLCDGGERRQSRDHLAALLRDHHLPPPD